MMANPTIVEKIAMFHPQESVRTRAGNLLVDLHKESAQLQDADKGFPEILEMAENRSRHFTDATAIYAGKVFIDLVLRRAGSGDISYVKDIADGSNFFHFNSKVQKYAQQRLAGAVPTTQFDPSLNRLRRALESLDGRAGSGIPLAMSIKAVAKKCGLDRPDKLSPSAKFRRGPARGNGKTAQKERCLSN